MNKDYGQLLTLLATGLLELYDQTLRGDSVIYPYPKPLQQGMHKLAAIQMDSGCEPIANIQSLLQLAEQPIEDWNINFGEEIAASSERLLYHGIPSQFCLDWAHDQGIDALSEERLLREVMDLCRQSERPDSYSAFRNMVIQKPVLTNLELQQAKLDNALRPLRDQLTVAYIQAPLSACHGSIFNCCGRCGSLLLRTDGNRFECENDRCRTEAPEIGRRIPADEGVLWLTSGLRRYVMRPGLVEIQLQATLASFGLSIEMWPNYDAYDLRVEINDEYWAVDVKDWSNPFKLARAAGPIRQNPSWDRAFYVFPDDRLKQRSDYFRAFSNRWDAPASTQAMMMTDFVHEVRRAMKRGT